MMKSRKIAAGAALALGMLASGCGAGLDHLGKEPSFSEFSSEPRMIPRSPTIAQQNPAEIDHRGYPGMLPTAQMGHTRSELGSPPPAPGQAQSMSMGPGGFGGIGGPVAAKGSLWSSAPQSLFGDRRARTYGDILTVLINIDDEASISNGTSTQRSGDQSMEAGALFGFEQTLARILPGDNGLNPGIQTSSSSSSSGQGQVTRNEAISLKIAARVIDVLGNGQLVITGRQEVRVNNELRDLQVVGIIRPEDISRNNEITYDKMAEARISYGGRGHLSDVQKARLGHQVLDMISPF